MSIDPQAPAYSYRVKAQNVPANGLTLEIEVGLADRAVIARRLDLESIDRLCIDVVVRPWRRDGLRVEGTIDARVEQQCVVTLDPVWSDVSAPFAGTFAPVGRKRPADTLEVVFDPLDENDPPEDMTDGSVDVGALAVEHLALAIDPYPRKADIVQEDDEPTAADEQDEDEKGASAFEVLRTLKPSSNGKDED